MAGVYSWAEDDGRRTGFAYAALIPVPVIGSFDECWTNVWPPAPGVDALIRMSVIPSDDDPGQANTSQVNSALGSGFDGPGRYLDRITRPTTWIVAAACVSALILGSFAGAWRVREKRLFDYFKAR